MDFERGDWEEHREDPIGVLHKALAETNQVAVHSKLSRVEERLLNRLHLQNVILPLPRLSEYYRIPVLGIKDIISSAKEGGDPDLIKDIAEEWPAINDYLQSNSPRKLDEAMKVFYRAVRWRLNQNDCFNRGFILENFPQFKE